MYVWGSELESFAIDHTISMYYVYVLKSKKVNREEIYVGSTNNLRRRLSEHNNGKDIATRRYKPWNLIYYEAYSLERLARAREKRLKQHGNAMKELKKRIGLYPAPFLLRNRIELIVTNESRTPLQSNRRKNGAGFTLIELLIVIALIGFLVGFLIINLIGVRQRARDGERKADLKTIQSALELYKADQGRYPTCAEYNAINCNSALTAGTSTYLNAIPCDPLTPSSAKYGFLIAGCPPIPQTYTLIACLENVNDKEKDAADGAPGDLCAVTGVVSYSATNP